MILGSVCYRWCVLCSSCGAPIQPNSAACPCGSSVFNFLNFAAQVYKERPAAHPTPYLLPALYGGDSGPNDQYETLFILQDPSKTYTEDNWRPCHSVNDAIERHRWIFRSWAFEPGTNQAILFSKFNQQRPSRRNRRSFFQRFYVTDIWKDCIPENYWLNKLQVELRGIQADEIVFVGGEAQKGAGLVGHSRKFYITHPGAHGMTVKQYGVCVQELWQQI